MMMEVMVAEIFRGTSRPFGMALQLGRVQTGHKPVDTAITVAVDDMDNIMQYLQQV